MTNESVQATIASHLSLVAQDAALPGNSEPMPVLGTHSVLGTRLVEPWPAGYQSLVFGMGCFWGAERLFWQQLGVYTTAVGYAGGYTEHPRYKQVCSGLTGHTEVVMVVYNPRECTIEGLLRMFWNSHDPTQGMRQGNDIGTQYRSAIYWTDSAQEPSIQSSYNNYGAALQAAGFGQITTEIKCLDTFYYAEAEHQQYLAKNPSGYCGLKGTGVKLASQ